MTDLTYFDGDYYDGKYHTVVKQGVPGTAGGYFESNYFDGAYFYDPANSSVFTLTADAISFQSKWSDTHRPVSLNYFVFDQGVGHSSSTNYSFNSSNKKEGSHSFEFPTLEGNGDGTEAFYLKSDQVLATGDIDNKSWVFDFWYYSEYSDTDNILIATIGNNTNAPVTEPPFTDSAIVLQIYEESDDLKARCQNNNGTLIDLNQNQNNNILRNDWNHISVVYDHTNSNITLRLNQNDNSTNWVDRKTGSFDEIFTGITNVMLHQPYWNYNGAASVGSRSSEVNFDLVRFAYDTTSYTRSIANVVNTETTLLLSRLNNNLDDDITLDLFANSILANTSSLSASLLTVQNVIATLTSQANITSSAISSLLAVPQTLDISTSLSAEGVIVKQASSNLSSLFDLDTAANKTALSQSNDLDVVANTNITATIDKGVSADLSGVFTPTITALAQKANDITLQSVSDVDCSAGTIKQGVSTVNSSFSVATDVTKTQIIESNLSCNAAISSTTTRTFSNAATLNSQFGIFTGTSKFLDAESNISSLFTTDIQALKQVVTETNIEVITNLSSSAGYIAFASIDLDSVFDTSAETFIINLDQYVYYIPVETRVNTISSETRLHSVRPEIRAHSVNKETRLQTIRTEDRVHEVKGT